MNLTMVGRLTPCLLLSYAIASRSAARLLPPGLQLITCRDCAFLNIVVCRVERIRPWFSPRSFGLTYWHVAYRLHVRATLENGGPIEGLYFLRSDGDQQVLSIVGNWFTDFRFHAARIHFSTTEAESCVQVRGTHNVVGDASVRLRTVARDCQLAESPFCSLQERERVLKYAPLSMAASQSGEFVRLAEVRRREAAWSEEPVEVVQADWAYPRSVGLEDLRLVRATRVKPIDYRWSLGRRERIKAVMRVTEPHATRTNTD